MTTKIFWYMYLTLNHNKFVANSLMLHSRCAREHSGKSQGRNQELKAYV